MVWRGGSTGMRLTRALTFLTLIVTAIGRVSAADGPNAITGTAVDAQGLPLPGVTATLRPAAGTTGEPQEMTTDAEGRFTFEALTPGTYALVLALGGFDDKTF